MNYEDQQQYDIEQVEAAATTIKGYADYINALIGPEKTGDTLNINSDCISKLEGVWTGSEADEYTTQLRNAQAKFSNFYNAIVAFSSAIKEIADNHRAANSANSLGTGSGQ